MEKLVDLLGIVPGGEAGIGVVTAIEISVIAAAVLAILFHRFRQPALLAYIVAGLALSLGAKPLLGSSVEVLEQISHLGLVLLLFVIGLEMDLKGILGLGKRAGAAIVLQAPVTIGAVWGLEWALDAMGMPLFGLGSSPRAWFFFAVAAGLSSTAVVVKLLADKFDLISQAGKVTVLTLIAQDIWAVLALSYVSSRGGLPEEGGSIVAMLAGAAVCALALWVVARFLVVRIMERIARSPDLMALVALGWCFIGAAALSSVGLSAEMGALIAGLTLGTLPTATEILAKVSSLRDFFMALFFVALGMILPPPTWTVMGAALSLVAIVIAARLLLFTPALLAARLGPLVSLAASINLAQISEFALLLVPIGVAQGALSIAEGSVISYAMMLSVLVTTYGIKYNYWLARVLGRLLPARLERPLTGTAPTEVPAHGASVLMLGFHLNARAVVQRLQEVRPKLLSEILAVDTALKDHMGIRALGVRVKYGDISNPETLRHNGVDRAEVVLSTIPDTFLRETSNRQLLRMVKTLNPHARFIGTALTREEADELIGDGAYGAVCVSDEAAPRYVSLLERGRELGPLEPS